VSYIRIIEVEGSSPLPLKWFLIELTEFANFQAQLIALIAEGRHYELRLATEAEALEYQQRQADWKRATYDHDQ
jgi:hypothetical protein